MSVNGWRDPRNPPSAHLRRHRSLRPITGASRQWAGQVWGHRRWRRVSSPGRRWPSSGCGPEGRGFESPRSPQV